MRFSRTRLSDVLHYKACALVQPAVVGTLYKQYTLHLPLPLLPPHLTDATKRKAPHKPILLLAVLDLMHRSIITTLFIAVTTDLVELNECFNLYWLRIILLGQISSIAFPFSHLDCEPFWELIPQPGKTITTAIINNTSSVSNLLKYSLGAKLDEGLFRVMQSGEGREALLP